MCRMKKLKRRQKRCRGGGGAQAGTDPRSPVIRLVTNTLRAMMAAPVGRATSHPESRLTLAEATLVSH